MKRNNEIGSFLFAFVLFITFYLQKKDKAFFKKKITAEGFTASYNVALVKGSLKGAIRIITVDTVHSNINCSL